MQHRASAVVGLIAFVSAVSCGTPEADDVERQHGYLDPLTNVIEASVAPASDTYVDNWSAATADEDYSSGSRLWVDDSSRTLLRFDRAAIVAALDDGLLVRASLRLTVDKLSGNAGTLRAYRMLQTWVSPTTYACGTETNPGNATPDCATGTEWDIDAVDPSDRPYVVEPTYSLEVPAIVPSGTMLELDVTVDVVRAIAENSETAWIIYHEDDGGWLSLFSSENTKDPAYDPELVLSIAEDDFLPATCPTPDIDETRISRTYDVVEHVHSGACPGQFAALVGDLDPQRIAHLRGYVTGPDGVPLAGVAARVVNHPEFGWARTRGNGYWDMAVNGGGSLIVELSKPGYLPVQRTVEALWNDYVVTDDVVLLPQQPSGDCEPMSSTTGGLYVEPSQTDGRGTRRMAVYVPDSSVVQIRSGGTTVTDYCVCSVEYTVDRPVGLGELRGEFAMPGELPPTSAYTYATDVELREQDGLGGCSTTRIPDPVFAQPSTSCTSDAMCSGGRVCVEGQCSSPVFAYVKDFLGFPVGAVDVDPGAAVRMRTVVPSGYYDTVRGSWMPEHDGYVVRVVDTGGDNCAFDVNGDTFANGDDIAVDDYSAHDITAAELSAFSGRCGATSEFQPGDTLWRIPLTHFSPFDWNWAADFIGDALIPFLEWADDGPTNGGCEMGGSIIGCEDQTLGEVIPVAGTPWGLHYQSARQRGRRTRYTLDVPFAGTPISGSSGAPPTAVHIRAQVAGRWIADERVDYSNGHYVITWDGEDAWGRLLQGAQPIRVQLGYVYPATYSAPSSSGGRSFGAGPGTAVTVDAREVIFWSTRRTLIGGWDESPAPGGGVRGRGLAGWSLTPQHVYDARAGILYRGDGTALNSRGVQPEISTAFYGPLTAGCLNSGGSPAACAPRTVAIAADGTLYFTDTNSPRIYRVRADATVERFAGSGTSGGVDGDRLTTASFTGPTDLAFTRTGSLLVLEPTPGRVRRIDGDVVTTVASGFPGAQGMAVGPGDWVYVSDTNNDRILAISPDGRQMVHSQSSTELDQPGAIAVNRFGHVIVETYTISGRRLKVVRPEGLSVGERITLIAGSAGGCSSNPDGDGGPAYSACLDDLSAIAVGPDGSIYVAEPNEERIRRISPTGIMETVAGAGGTIDPVASPARQRADGGPAVSAHFMTTADVWLAANGALYVADSLDQRIRVVRPALPDSVVGEVVVAEPDGSLIYRFDERGRHIATESGLTGETLFTFTYVGTSGVLSTIQSAHSDLSLEVSRDGGGVPLSLKSVYGEESSLGVEADGYLHTFQGPDGEFHAEYWDGAGEDGLLYQFWSDATGVTEFEYDTVGRLTRDHSGAGLDQRLVRLDCGAGLTCGEGETGWRVTHRYHTSSGDPASWQARIHDVLYASSISQRTIRDELGTMTTWLQGELDLDPLSTIDDPLTPSVDVESAPIVLHAESSVSGHLDIAHADDPRPGLEAYARAVRILRPAAVGAPTTPSPARTEISVQRTTMPAAPATMLDVDELTEVMLVRGMSGGVTQTRRSEARYVRAGSGWCAANYHSSESPAGNLTEACLDDQGRIHELRAPGLDPVVITYDPSTGRTSSVSQGTRSTVAEYQAPGSSVDQWWPGEVRIYSGGSEQDRLEVTRTGSGLVTNVRYVNVPGGTDYSIGLQPDMLGRVTQMITPAPQVHGQTWTDHNAPQTYSPPFVGAARPGVLNVPLFDPAHRPEQLDVRDNSTVLASIDYVYDSTYGYLSALVLPGGRSVAIVRDTALAPGTVAAAADGHVASITLDGNEVDLSYDGSLLDREDWTGAVAGYVDRTWDSFGQLDALNVSGQSIDYAYDLDGRLTQAGSLTTSTYLTGSGASQTWARSTALGSTSGLESHSRLGELSSMTISFPGGSYGYYPGPRDYLGRETSRTENLPGLSQWFQYTYDGRGRLQTVRLGGAVVAQYTYDSNGNRDAATYSGAWVHADRPSVAAAATTYDAQDRMTSYGGCTYTYSTAGALQQRTCTGTGTTLYDYDLLGNLLRVTLRDGRVIEYELDGFGRRIVRRVKNGGLVEEEQRWLYLGGLHPVAELDDTNTLRRVFVYGTRANVPDYIRDLTGTPTNYRVISDPRGSVRAIVNASTGAEVQRITYDAFGFVLSDTSPGYQPFGFAGGLYDPRTGLVRFGARDYDSVAGRWTAKDPILFEAGDPNIYGYVGGDPINSIDPSGLLVDTFVDIGFIAYDVYQLASGCGSWTALGLDVLGMFIPFVTGLGWWANHGDDVVRLYHGSVSNYSGILRNGLDPTRAPTWVTTSRAAAENAIGPGRVLSPGEGLDRGIIESVVPRADFERLIQSGGISPTRNWPGFGGGRTLPENVLRSPEAVALFNKGIVQ